MKRLFLFITAAICSGGMLRAQSASNPSPKINDRITASSPNAAALGTYGNVPVNLSTGQLSYNIPIYELSNHDITVPVSLSYSNQGFKPNDHPSSVGLGWSLNAGGVITRVRHGEADEMIVRGTSGSNVVTFLNNTSYMNNATARANLAGVTPGSTSAQAFNDLLKTQSFALQNNASNGGATTLFDSEPDEFMFNFNGITGKFVYDNASNNYIVTTSSSDVFKVVVSTRDNLEFDPTTVIPRCIDKITITTYSGYKYEFGGLYDGVNDNIELFLGAPSGKYLGSGNVKYDRGNCLYTSSWFLSKITSPQGVTADFAYVRRGISATIEPAIDLGQIGSGSGTMRSTNYNTYSILLNTTTYLRNITTGSKRMVFTHRPTAYELINGNYNIFARDEEYPDFPAIVGTTLSNYLYDPIHVYKQFYGTNIVSVNANAYSTFTCNWQRLDSIEAYDGTDLLLSDTFAYNKSRIYLPPTQNYPPTGGYSMGTSATGRLELKSIVTKGSSSGAYQPYYSFSYYGQGTASNVSDYKPYGTRRVDHWGFYNGQDYFSGVDTTTLNLSSAAGLYASYRDASSGGVSLNGMLSKITYPTGGTTEIVYEPNDYGKRVKYDGSNATLGLYTESANKIAGGYRVRSVTNKSNIPNSVPVTKTYFYQSNYPSSSPVSTGILNCGYPEYGTASYPVVYSDILLSGTPTTSSYTTLSNSGRLPGYMAGNYITYSKVIEQYADNSYKQYEYSNSDVSAYIDQVIKYSGTAYNKNGLDFQWFLSRADERGKLLKESFFKPAATVAEKVITYEYNTDFTKKINFMKKDGQVLENATGIATNPAYTLRSYLSSYYSYYGFLKKKTETTNLGTQSITLVTDYNYDGYRNLLSETVTHNPQLKYITQYSYSSAGIPVSGSSSLAQSVNNLSSNELYRYPVEMVSKVVKNGSTYVTGGKIFTYMASKPVIQSESVLETTDPIAQSNFSSLEATGAPDAKYNMNSTEITAFSQPVAYPQTISKNGDVSATLRDYDQRFITGVVKNAAYADVAYSSFEGNYTNASNDVNKCNWQFNENYIDQNTGVTGNRSFLLGSSSIRVNTLQPGKRYILSYWTKNGSVYVNVAPPNGFVNGPVVNGWQNVSCVFEAGGTSLQISGSGNIDEVRLYPEGATMQTYTYDILNGMSSQCSATGVIVTYEYDNMHRLYVMRDADGKILKKIEYGVQVAE